MITILKGVIYITVLIYNDLTNKMEGYYLSESSAMPYAGSTLTVGEFAKASSSQTVWSDRRAMISWNQFRAMWGQPIYVGYAFRRIGEGGHANQSQHYAGVSFDVGQNLDNDTRDRMRILAQNSGLWGYVEPASLTPTWVHFDRRTGTPACSAGYPLVRRGSLGVYVCVLQDALETAGISNVGIDGVFGPRTAEGVRTFQNQQGLSVDGIVGCVTWSRVTSIANGRFRRSPFIPAEYSVE